MNRLLCTLFSLIGMVQISAHEPLKNEKFNLFCSQAIQTYSPSTPRLLSLGLNNNSIEQGGEALLLRNYLCPKHIVFDVGANVGGWSLTAQAIQPEIVLYSFEPEATTFSRLQAKAQRAGKGNITCCNLALSNYVGKSEFFVSRDNKELSSLYCREYFGTTGYFKQSTDVDTIDHFCSSHSIDTIDFLKIDTEGAELQVLKGALRLLREKKIMAIQFEYGGTYQDAKTTLQETMQLLTDCGYVLFRIHSDGLVHFPTWQHCLENYQLCNYFAVLQSELPQWGLMQGFPIQNEKH